MACTVCFEEDPAKEFDLIHPCACTSPVHRECLDEWRIKSSNRDAVTQCMICKTPFEFDEASPIQSSFQFKRFCVCELFLRSILILFSVFCAGTLVFLIDQAIADHQLEKLIEDPNNRFIVFICLSVATAMFFLGLLELCRDYNAFCVDRTRELPCDGCRGMGILAITPWTLLIGLTLLFILLGAAVVINFLLGAIIVYSNDKLSKNSRRTQVQRMRVKNLRPETDI